MVYTRISHIKCGIQLESHITVHRILMNFDQALSCIKTDLNMCFQQIQVLTGLTQYLISSKTSDSVHKVSKNPCTMHPSCQLPSGSSTIYLRWATPTDR